MSASRKVTLGAAVTGLSWGPGPAGVLRYGGAGAAAGPAELAASKVELKLSLSMGRQTMLYLESVDGVEEGDVGEDAGGEGQLRHHQGQPEREVQRLGPGTRGVRTVWG